MYKIESGVPMPERVIRKKYPYEQLEVGQSFFVPCKKDAAKMKQISIGSTAARHKPKRFTVSVVKDGVRCWRIE